MGEEEEKEQGERSVLPEGTKRQRVARRQDASESDGQPMPEFMTAWGESEAVRLGSSH